ncbi:MAG: hypothetical protein WCO30_01365 [bacterium]
MKKNPALRLIELFVNGVKTAFYAVAGTITLPIDFLIVLLAKDEYAIKELERMGYTNIVVHQTDAYYRGLRGFGAYAVRYKIEAISRSGRHDRVYLYLPNSDRGKVCVGHIG